MARPNNFATPGKLPEVLTSPLLASILVPALTDAIDAYVDVAKEQGRAYSAEPIVSAMRALSNEIDAYHRTPAQ